MDARTINNALTGIAINGTDFGVHHMRMRGLIARGLVRPLYTPYGTRFRLTAAGWDAMEEGRFVRVMAIIRRDAGLEPSWWEEKTRELNTASLAATVEFMESDLG